MRPRFFALWRAERFRAFISITRSNSIWTASISVSAYVPGDSSSRAYGGNSNWRGPVWMPVNFMLVEALYGFHRYYGDDFRVEYPTGSGVTLSLREIADELAARLTRLFLRGPDGRRPASGPPRCSKRIRIFAITCCSTSFSTATPARGSAPLTKPAGPGWWLSYCTGGSRTTPRRWICRRGRSSGLQAEKVTWCGLFLKTWRLLPAIPSGCA